MKEILDRWGLTSDKPVHKSWEEWLDTYCYKWPGQEKFLQTPIPRGPLQNETTSFGGLFGNTTRATDPDDGLDLDIVLGGFIPIGGANNGDMLVIDTRSEIDFEVGFISHELAWSEDRPQIRDCYRSTGLDLETFLDRLFNDGSTPRDFYDCPEG